MAHMTVIAAYVVARLEEAGATLACLPISARPASYGSGWPDIVRDAIEAYGYTPDRVRPRVPSAAAISSMDTAFAWLALIPSDRYVLRRMVAARSMVHPLTGRHLASWRKLGRLVGADHRACQRWHGNGIAIIATKLYASGAVDLDVARAWLDERGLAMQVEAFAA